MACAPELDLREGYEIYNKMILAGSPIVDHRPVPICPTGVSSQVALNHVRVAVHVAPKTVRRNTGRHTSGWSTKIESMLWPALWPILSSPGKYADSCILSLLDLSCTTMFCL